MRADLAEVLDLVAHIARWCPENIEQRYEREFAQLAITRIRHEAGEIGDRAWRRAEQAGDLLRIEWSQEYRGWAPGPAQSPSVEWQRLWAAREVLDENLDEIADTAFRLSSELLRLWYQLGSLMGEMERLEPRALPRCDVDSILIELHRRWEEIGDATRLVASERRRETAEGWRGPRGQEAAQGAVAAR